LLTDNGSKNCAIFQHRGDAIEIVPKYATLLLYVNNLRIKNIPWLHHWLCDPTYWYALLARNGRSRSTLPIHTSGTPTVQQLLLAIQGHAAKKHL